MTYREQVLFVTRMPDALKPLDIWAGDPPEPIPCEILAISHARDTGHPDRDSYVLYFLDSSGRVHECLQYESIEIARDQAGANTGIADCAWTRCDPPIEVDEGDNNDDADYVQLDVSSFPLGLLDGGIG